jgi:hypothetical protein
MPLLPQRTLSNTDVEHLADHNQIHPKLNDWPNVVRDYGAVGDDSTNNAAAIQAAIDATANVAAARGRGGTLVFPPGIYRTSSTIVLKEGVQLLGLGRPGVSDARYGAFINGSTSGMTVLSFPDSGSVNQNGLQLTNMGISCNGGLANVTGLLLSGLTFWRVDNCVFLSPGNGEMATGIKIEAGANGNLDDNWGVLDRTDFRRVRVGVENTDGGLHANYCSYVASSAMAGQGTIGFKMTATTTRQSQNNRIVGCEFEPAGGGMGILCQGSFNRIIACHVEGDSATQLAVAGYKFEKVAGSSSQAGTRSTVLASSAVKCAAGLNFGSGCSLMKYGGMQFISNTTDVVDNATGTINLDL